MRVSEEMVFLQDSFTLVPPTTLKREEVVRLVLLRVPRTTGNLMLAGLDSYWMQDGTAADSTGQLSLSLKCRVAPKLGDQKVNI